MIESENKSRETISKSPELKYRLFIDRMKFEIEEAVGECFDSSTDPEICFSVFRNFLRKIKKENVKEYLEFMESDDDFELEDSEIAKWRKLNNNT